MNETIQDEARQNVTAPRPNGWAVVSKWGDLETHPNTYTSNDLHIIPVRESPGATGPVIPTRGKNYPYTYGTVQATRDEARGLKTNLATKYGIRRVTADEHNR